MSARTADAQADSTLACSAPEALCPEEHSGIQSWTLALTPLLSPSAVTPGHTHTMSFPPFLLELPQITRIGDPSCPRALF